MPKTRSGLVERMSSSREGSSGGAQANSSLFPTIWRKRSRFVLLSIYPSFAGKAKQFGSLQKGVYSQSFFNRLSEKWATEQPQKFTPEQMKILFNVDVNKKE